MVCKSKNHMTELACRALFALKIRGVVLSGWAKLGPDLLDKTMPDHAELLELYRYPPAM